MSQITGNLNVDPLRAMTQEMVYTPFSFESDGAAFVSAKFDYPGVEWSDEGGGTVRLTFDADLPDETVAIASAVGGGEVIVTIGTNTVDFAYAGQPANGVSVDVLMCVSGVAEKFIGGDEGVSIGDMDRYIARNQSEGVAGRDFATIIGKFVVVGGVTLVPLEERGFYVSAEDGTAFSLYVGKFDEEKAALTLNSSGGSITPTLDGDAGLVTLTFSGAAPDCFVEFLFMAQV